MKQSVVRELSDSDLLDKIAEQKELLAKMKMNHTVSPLENPMKLNVTKKIVARLLTEFRKRELQKEKIA